MNRPSDKYADPGCRHERREHGLAPNGAHRCYADVAYVPVPDETAEFPGPTLMCGCPAFVEKPSP